MWWYNSVELVFLVASIGACAGGFVALACSNCRMSRCVKIRISPCGCECIRENLTEEEYDRELKNQHDIEGQMARVADAPPQQAEGVAV